MLHRRYLTRTTIRVRMCPGTSATPSILGMGAFQYAMPTLQPYSEIRLDTRCENQVENETDRRAVRAGDKMLSDDYKKDYPDGKHRPTAATRKYNCHGFTFASRRTWISNASEIVKILRDDEYERVTLDQLMPGDVVVYFLNGDAEHSGMIVETGFVPLILSKWGPAHEVIHRVNDCPYDSMEIKYYRIRT
jgi:hypothetical protein